MADRIAKIILRGDIGDLKAKLTVVSKSLADVGDRMTGTTKEAAKFRRGLTTLGDSAGKMGLVAAAGLGAIVVATANFDQAMSKVQAATHETTSNMDAMRDAAIEAGAKTAFSASEAAAGIENLAKAGVATKDILGGGLSGALDLAAAGELGVAEAAETAATALVQFKLKGEDVPHVADLLAAAAGKAQGEVSDFGMALKQGGLVAAQMGLSIEETTGTLAAFASAGLLGSDAGTSLKTMLLKLANPSAAAADTMAELGINAYDANGNLVSMSELAGQLQVAFQGQSQSTRDAAMATIFGSDAIRAAAILYSEGADGVADWTNKVNDSGFAAETAAIKLDNLKGDLEAFKGSLETALIGSGEGSQGPLRGLVQGATDAVNAFNSLPPAAKNVTAGLLGIVAVTGGALWFGSKVITSISSTRVAMDALGVSAGRTGAAMSAVGKGAVIAGAALAGLAATDFLQGGGLDKSLPTLNELANKLNALGTSGAASTLPKQFNDIAAAIERIGDPNRAQAFQDSIAGVIGFGGGDEVKNFRAEIELLDGALAKIATSGGAGAAEDALAEFAAAQDLSKGQVSDLVSLMPQYRNALAGSASAADLAAGATDGLSDATEGATAATMANTASLDENIDAMRENRSERLGAFNAETRYAEALANSKKAIEDNGKTLDKNTPKGRANRDVLSAQAAAWNDLSDKAKNADGAHRNAVDAFVATAVAMGKDEKAARLLARQLLEIKPRAVKVTAETDPARRAIETLLADMSGRTIGIGVRVTAPQVDYSGVFGPKHATGGHIRGPGTATSDSIPAYLSNGEYVVRAAAVQKYGTHMFDNLNAMRLASGGPVNGYATGGKVKGPTLGDIDITLDMDTSQVRDELRDFAKGIRDAGGHVGAGFDDLKTRLIASSKELDGQRKALEDSKSALDSMRDAATSMAESVSSMFQRDIFGSDSGNQVETPTAGLPDNFSSLTIAEQRVALEKQRTEQAKLDAVYAEINADFDQNRRHNMLVSDIADARAFRAALSVVDRKDGKGTSEFFKGLASSGNTQQAEIFAGMSRRDLAQEVQLYAERIQVANSVGRSTARAATHEDIQELIGVTQELRKDFRTAAGDRAGILSDAKIQRLATATGNAVGAKINHAAAGAQRSKK